MDLYNLLFGNNPHAKTLLDIIDVTLAMCGRIRDVYVSKDNKGHFIIVLFTRNGGENRKCWKFNGCLNGKHDPLCMVSIIKGLRAHPLYIKDYDIQEDPTYASFEFRVPPNRIELVEHIYSMTKDKRTPIEKFTELLTKMEKGDMSDPEVVNAINIGKDLLEFWSFFLKNLKKT